MSCSSDSTVSTKTHTPIHIVISSKDVFDTFETQIIIERGFHSRSFYNRNSDDIRERQSHTSHISVYMSASNGTN